jgi:hypothetical protein
VGPGVETRTSSAYRSHCIGWNIEEIKAEIEKKSSLGNQVLCFNPPSLTHPYSYDRLYYSCYRVLLGSLARATFKQNFSDIN